MRGGRGVVLEDLGLVLELVEQLQLGVADADQALPDLVGVQPLRKLHFH